MFKRPRFLPSQFPEIQPNLPTHILRKPIQSLKRFSLERLESRQLLSGVVWLINTSLPSARGDSAAISNSSGVIVFGGTTTGTSTTTSVLLLNPNNNLANSPLVALPQGKTGLAVGETGNSGPYTTTTDGISYKYASDVFVYGGTTSTTPGASVLNYVSSNRAGESIVAPSLSVARADFAHAVDPSTGDLYAIGGLSTSGVTLTSAEIYDPTADSWSPIAPLPVALSYASGTTDGAGHIFVFGGKTASGAPVSTVYRYTIATNTWDARTAMPLAVSDATAVYGFYGEIYVAGGKSSAGAVKNFEIYNPVLDTWTAQTPLPNAVYGAAGAIDSNSNLDLIGGFSSAGTTVNTVESTPVTPSSVALPQPPTITVSDEYPNYDAVPQSATATAIGSDGLTPVDGTFTYTYNGSTTEPTNAGTYQVVARFTSNDSAYVDGAADGTLTIDSVLPTLSVTGGGTFTYNGQPHPLTATVVGVDGVTPVAGTIAYTYNGSTTVPVTWGTYTAVATFTSSDPNYVNTAGSDTVTIPDPRIPTGVVDRNIHHIAEYLMGPSHPAVWNYAVL